MNTVIIEGNKEDLDYFIEDFGLEDCVLKINKHTKRSMHYTLDRDDAVELLMVKSIMEEYMFNIIKD